MSSSSSSKTIWHRLSERPVFLGWFVALAVLGYAFVVTSVSLFISSILLLFTSSNLDLFSDGANIWLSLLGILIGTGFLVVAVAVAAKANSLGLREELWASKGESDQPRL